MNWKSILAPVLSSPKMTEIKLHLQEERKTKTIYPVGFEVFRAFDLCPYENTKVVILGNEPYNEPGIADGLAYYTRSSKRPAALEVIFKEIYKDLNIQYFKEENFENYFPTNNLEKWAQRGFLLLNITLTVEEGKVNSHKNLGWQAVTIAVLKALSEKKTQVIFLLWGKEAQKYEELIDPNSKHLVLRAGHPYTEVLETVPGNFYGNGHFSVVRDVLPETEGVELMPKAGLDACFDKEKAKEIARTKYPIDAERMCQYIDNELILNVPVNKERYWKEIRKFEDAISTKYDEE